MFKVEIGKTVECYVDDMIVKSTKSSNHVADLSQIFAKLRRYNMKLNPTKCAFRVRSGKFLGFMVSQRGIEVNPNKITAIKDMQSPKTVKDVQRLTGRLVALSRFMSKLAEKGLSFFKALRKTENFQWTESCEDAFQQLKAHLQTLPGLASPKIGDELCQYMSISQEVVGSALFMEKEGKQKPVYFISKVL